MKQFAHSVTINAMPDAVWAALIDTPNWTKFDPFCDGVEGVPALGERVKIRTKLAPGRVFNVQVTRFDPPHTMIWSDGMPLGLFKGERTYTISRVASGACTFSMREAFSGPLLPMIEKHLPDMTDAFAAFCNGLKDYVENNISGTDQ